MDPDLNPKIAPPDRTLGQNAPDGAAIPTAAIPGQKPAPVVTQPGATPAIAALAPTPTEVEQPAADGDTKLFGLKLPAALLGNNKLLLVVGGAVVLLLLLVVIIVAGGSGNKPVVKRTNTASVTPLPEVVDRPDGGLDLSRRVDTNAVIHEQTIEASASQQVNMSNGLSLIVEAVGDYSSTTTLPATGKKFVIILVTVGNHALSGNTSISYLDFQLEQAKPGDDKKAAEDTEAEDDDKNLLTPHAITQTIANNPLAVPVELKPGAQTEGRLIYEVDSTSQGWTLIHKETYRKASDNTKFDVEADILLKVRSTASDTSTSSTGSSSSNSSSRRQSSQTSGSTTDD